MLLPRRPRPWSHGPGERYNQDTMKVRINGEETEVAAGLNLAQLVEQMGMKGDRVAVERNREIVSRAQWAETQLAEGDLLEIVHFVGGGSA